MPSALGGQAAISFLPAGAMVDFAGTTAPSGWLMCDGAAVSRTVYADLFSSLGTAYGVGDGSTTFNLPDYRGRFARYMDDMGTLQSAGFVDASTITAGSFVIGRKYKITFVGTTSFTAVGASSNTIGVVFTATGVGSGTGTALESNRVRGSSQSHAAQSHNHSLPYYSGTASSCGSTVNFVRNATNDSGSSICTVTGTITSMTGMVGSNSAEETRPVNLASYRIIKF